jgi:hypothetical protein
MPAGRHMPNRSVIALLGSVVVSILAGTGAAVAEQLCFPHCDYTHYYGPLDFSYRQPGLFGYPHCGPQGDCSPHLAYTTGILRPILTGRIIVRLPRAKAPSQP